MAKIGEKEAQIADLRRRKRRLPAIIDTMLGRSAAAPGESKLPTTPEKETAPMEPTPAPAPPAEPVKETTTMSRTKTSKKASKAKARKAVKGKTAKRSPSKSSASKPARSGSKTDLIGKMLTRPDGCTAAEVLKATDWPAVSMPQQAKACGLKLRKEKDGRVTRYYGSAA